MQNISIHHVGVFRKEEHMEQTPGHIFLMLVVRGLVSLQCGESVISPKLQPFLMLLMPGETIDFAFGPDRENWVAQLDTKCLRAGKEFSVIEILHNKTWIPFPRLFQLEHAQVPQWRRKFENLREHFSYPTPRGRLLARLGVWEILQFLIAAHRKSSSGTPAQALKKLIDNDISHSCSIEELSRQAGFNSDYLRKLFIKEFQIAPLAYRRQYQLAQVMELIANTNLNVSQIAQQTGFRHVSHLSSRFQEQFSITAKEAIRRYRYSQ